MYQTGLPLPSRGAPSNSKVPPSGTPAPSRSALQQVAPPNRDASMMMPPPPKPGTAGSKRPAPVPSNSEQQRISLSQRAAGTARGAPMAPPPTTRLVHSRSISGRIQPQGLSKSMGSRPTTSMGFNRGAQPSQPSQPFQPSQSSQPPQQAPRPTSAQDMNEGDDIERDEPLIKLPKRQGWDVKNRLLDNEKAVQELRDMISQDRKEKKVIQEELEVKRNKEIQYETMRVTIECKLAQTQHELESYRKKSEELVRVLDDERRERANERDILVRRLRDDTDDLQRRHRDEMDSTNKAHREELEIVKKAAREELETLARKLKLELMDEQAARTREVQELRSTAALEKQTLERQLDGGGRELSTVKMELDLMRQELERERSLTASLRDNLSQQNNATIMLESSSRALKARIELLEGEGKTQVQNYEELHLRLKSTLEDNEALREKLGNEEIVRRKLHNQIQELKGNIRVFCRVRPTLGDEAASAARIEFPDCEMEGKEISVLGPVERNMIGQEVTKTHPFSFDKVFSPTHQNADVFEEISQLVQSALDGYNVCIFCYGQTGSGKTYTMSAEDGMIPRAVHQIYDTAKGLEERGWIYTMTGNFVEVYNENINDLLGKADDLDRKKHEIRHDPKELKTTITDVETVVLDNPSRVDHILRQASNTRSVAATKANERSSRSHSVFILKLVGVNSVTGERSEGTLNLVDLAGSERLAHSQSTGERLKETQNINRSLSCLGDVIAALGNGKDNGHIPYRNSKLTYLLQYSLGGNSKCLMFVMVSPMMAHLNETLTSLKFATKVNNTSIGTAKKQVKV